MPQQPKQSPRRERGPAGLASDARLMRVVRSHRVWGAPFQRPQDANAFPKVPRTCFPPAAWPEPFPLPSLSVRQPPQAGQTAACGHKCALGCPTPSATLSPQSELGSSVSAGELLLSRQNPGAGRLPGGRPDVPPQRLPSAHLLPRGHDAAATLTASCSPARPLPPASRCQR